MSRTEPAIARVARTTSPSGEMPKRQWRTASIEKTKVTDGLEAGAKALAGGKCKRPDGLVTPGTDGANFALRPVGAELLPAPLADLASMLSTAVIDSLDYLYLHTFPEVSASGLANRTK